MSSIDPTIAAAQAFVLAAEQATEQAALDLGAAADEIVAQLTSGDLLTATVLAPQNGSDRLEIFGQAVTAQLPPGIHPGETIVLQVNGFQGNAILVTNLGPEDPQNPPQLAQVVVTPAAEGGDPNAEAPVSATLTRIATPPPAVPVSEQNVPAAPVSPQQIPPQAPPREVFVAASVRPAPPSNIAPEIVVRVAPQIESTIEARMVANRAAAPLPPANPGAPVIRVPLVPAGRPSLPLSAILTPRSDVVARQAVTQSLPLAERVAGDEFTSLLQKIRIPVTPLTLAAARIAKDAVASIPRVFAQLEALLPKVLPEQAAPLRSLLAFVGKFDLGNVRALPEQIAAFVSHVIEGAEAKLAQGLAEHHAADATPEVPAHETNAPASPGARNVADASLPGENDAPSANALTSHARAAERIAMADFDLKSALVALSQSPQTRATPQLAQALNDALTAVTGAQVGTLASAAGNPGTIAIALPAFFYDGGKPAQLMIDRDAPNGGKKMDADNFRIAFVLDTASLGTIAIDVETVGRAIKVDVRTERSRAAERFTNTLPDLRTRFEQLRYRVASMTAGVALPAGSSMPTVSAPAPDPSEPVKGLDLQA